MGGRASASAPTDMSADGDSVYLWTTLKGALNIADAGGSITVDNAGTFAVQATIAAGATSIAKAEDAASADADVGVAMMARRTAAPANTSGADLDYEMLQMSAGRLWVDPSGVTLTVASHAVTNAGTFLAQVTGNTAHDGASPSSSPVLVGGYAKAAAPTDVSADGNAVQAWYLRNGAQTTVLTAAGALIGGDAANGLDVDVTRLSALVAGSALIGDVGIGVRTSGGATPYKTLDLDESEEEVKATAGQVYGMHVMNVTNALRYIKFYNATAANVTVGSTTPVMTIPVPGNNDTDGAGFVWACGPIAFGTAICIAATTAAADADTGAPGTGDVIATILYN